MVELDNLKAALRAIPKEEHLPFRCPKCGESILMPTLAFIGFGAPNVHQKCGYSGDDMKVAV